MTEHYLPLADAVNTAILMHRDAHFNGSFPLMLDYYRTGQRGIQPDISEEKIQELFLLEQKLGQNLAPLLLTGTQAEEVGASKAFYKNLRNLYESKTVEPYALLIADMILTEDLEGEAEIAAIVAQKEKIVPFLLKVLNEERFNNPVFPGYGQTPGLVMRCLAKLGDRRSIAALFERIGRDDFFDEERALDALKSIGRPAKEFLVKVLSSKPITADNERAAVALMGFLDLLEGEEKEALSCTALTLLSDPDARKELPFANYLALLCSGLPGGPERELCRRLAEDPQLPKTVRDDLKQILKSI